MMMSSTAQRISKFAVTSRCVLARPLALVNYLCPTQSSTILLGSANCLWPVEDENCVAFLCQTALCRSFVRSFVAVGPHSPFLVRLLYE